MKMKQITGFVLCLIGTAAVILWGILWSVEYVGTDAELYRKLQFEARPGILEYAGISENDLRTVNEALAQCLRGDPDVLEDLEAEVFGKSRPAFNARERVHMEDCRKLFSLARTVRRIAVSVGIAAVCAGFALNKKRRSISIALCLGPALIMLPIAALALWAAADFNAAFNFFHEVLFTNDLWLLDPATDLLIRICPQRMFMNMGARIGLMGLAFAITVPCVGLVAVRVFLRKQTSVQWR